MKKYILPIIAVVVVIIAAVVLIVVPKSGSTEQANDPKIDSAANTVAKASDDHVEILASQLSEDKISLFSVADDSKVELIAIKGADSKARVAFATCQSCNGSPGAYYTQSGDLLQCNSCGLTFPLSVIGEDGSGCHPIMLDDTKVKEIDDVVSIDKAYLLSLESLFKNVAEH